MSYLKIWGCEVFVKRPTSDKLGPKADKYFFVGYPKEMKGYYFYYQSENKIIVARHGIFLEKEFLAKESSGSNVILEEIQVTLHNTISDTYQINSPLDSSANEHLEEPNPQIVVEEILVPSSSASMQVETKLNLHTDVDGVRQPEEQVLRRSHRTVRAPERYMGLHEVSVFDAEDPLTYAEAVDRPDSDKWLEAMRSEIQSMYDNTVWNLVASPVGVKLIANKWVFKRKIDMDGNITVYKARLVAKCFKQILGVDYDETFSPVAMFKSIRILLAIVVFHDYEI
jgi:Reverse transcriptase (RNA-dependent DNA polymerase)